MCVWSLSGPLFHGGPGGGRTLKAAAAQSTNAQVPAPPGGFSGPNCKSQFRPLPFIDPLVDLQKSLKSIEKNVCGAPKGGRLS